MEKPKSYIERIKEDPYAYAIPAILLLVLSSALVASVLREDNPNSNPPTIHDSRE